MTALVMTVASILAQGAPAATPAPAPPAARETRAPAPESIGSLLAEPPAAEERTGVSGGVFYQMLGWVAALGVLALAAVRIWRRLAARAGLGAGSGGLRVVSRAALTPRHFIYTVRLGSQRLLVVGVSGDRITALSEFDDPAQVMALDPTFEKSLERAGAPPAGDPAEAAGGGGDGDLSPYRREVQRLSEMVRGWRRAAGGWGRAAGDWRLAAGAKRLAAGDWRGAAGDLRLAAGGRTTDDGRTDDGRTRDDGRTTDGRTDGE